MGVVLWTCRGRAMLLATSVLALPAAAAKTDVIVLDNGDRITGEIKGMSRGKIDFSTDDAGRLSVEWTKVAQVTSVHVFEVEMSSGQKHYGQLRPGPEEKQLIVGPEGAQAVVPIAAVVSITTMDELFFSRVRAYLDLGFTLAKANSALTLSADGEFAYRGEHLGAALNFDTYLQDDANNNLVSRASAYITGTYFFTRWRAQLQLGVDHNDELDLKVRVYLGAGAAYPVVRNTWTELWLKSGLVADRETYTTGTPNLNLAALVAADWEAFRYDSPKLDLGVQVDILPVLTDPGRLRGTSTIRIKYELFADFNVGLNFSYTFDTRPPDPTAGHTDYLLSLTIGWSYRR